MTMAAPVVKSWTDKLIAGFRASPGKSSTVSGLAVILVIVWCRFFFGGHLPAAASGAAALSPSELPASFSNYGVTSRPAGTANSLQQWAHQPIRPLNRNPFAIPLDLYPRDAASSLDSPASQSGYWDLVAKSLSSRADQQEQRQILTDNVRIAAASLKLESTIMGARRGAMINGNMVREGDSVAGFRVLNIQPGQVIVEREGIKLALQMQ
jgi:hypothetical protein